MCLQQPLSCYVNDLITYTAIAIMSCGAEPIVNWGLPYSVIREKINQIVFHWDIRLFFDKLFSSTSYDLKKSSYDLHKNCHKTFYIPISCSLRFLLLDNARKNCPEYFFRWKKDFFVKKNVFSPTSFVLRKLSYNLHSDCHFILWRLNKC